MLNRSWLRSELSSVHSEQLCKHFSSRVLLVWYSLARVSGESIRKTLLKDLLLFSPSPLASTRKAKRTGAMIISNTTLPWSHSNLIILIQLPCSRKSPLFSQCEPRGGGESGNRKWPIDAALGDPLVSNSTLFPSLPTSSCVHGCDVIRFVVCDLRCEVCGWCWWWLHHQNEDEVSWWSLSLFRFPVALTS